MPDEALQLHPSRGFSAQAPAPDSQSRTLSDAPVTTASNSQSHNTVSLDPQFCRIGPSLVTVARSPTQQSIVSHYLPIILSLRRLPRLSGNIVHTSDASFPEDVLKANVPVLLDFWAEWCGPCKAIAPILEEIAKDYDGRVKIAKIDIDRNPQTPQKYGVRGIPTLILFKNGAPQAQQVGLVQKSKISALLDSHL
jgi:thioredoxin 1